MTASASSSDRQRPTGTMQRMANARVLVTGLLVVSLAMAGFAFAPGLFELDPNANPSAEASNFAPTPVGENEAVYKAFGKDFTRKALQDELRPYASQQVIDALADPGTANPTLATNMSATLSSVISAELIADAVAEAKVGISEEELKTKLDDFIKENFDNEEAYKEALKQFDLTEQGMMQQLRFPIEAERLTDFRYPINEADLEPQLKPLYDEKYKSGKVVRHIQLNSKDEADKAMQRLIAGEDFAKLATELSQDSGTATKGGLIGPFTPGVLDEAYDNAVNGTEIGKVGGPFQDSLGWQIIKVEGVPTFEEARAELIDQVRKGIQAENWVSLSEELEQQAQFTLDPRFGRWKGMAFGGITPAFEARLRPTPQPSDTPSS